MKLSRRELLAAGAASVAAGMPARGQSTPAVQSDPAAPALKTTPHPPNLPVRDYLVREARRITENALADLKTSADFNRRIAERRRQYMDMMGLADLAPAKDRAAVPYKVTGVLDRPKYLIEKLHYESLPNRIKAVLLESPPATQNAASQPSGKGPAIEMLNCLRYADLAHIAGLLHPAEIVVSGEFPSTFAWAEDHRRLGSSVPFHRVKAISEWMSS